MIRASFARMCIRMMGCVVDCSCGDESLEDDGGNPLLSVDIEHEPTASALTWVHALQHALAMDVLGESLAGIDDRASAMYVKRGEGLVSGVLRDVSMSGLGGARIVPHIY